MNGPFSPEPHTLEEYVRAIWHDLREMRAGILSDRARLDAIERAVRDLQVFTTWLFKLIPLVAVVVAIVSVVTR